MIKLSDKRWWLPAAALLLSGWFILAYAHFFRFTPAALGKYLPWKFVLLLHISGGAIALLTGPWQFISAFRNRYMRAHRIIGRVYLLAIAASALSALWLTLTTGWQVSPFYAISLQVLAFVWLLSSAMAFYTIRRRQIKEHREWMVRSYLATFAFVLQNLILRIPGILQNTDFVEVSPHIFWASWTLPYVFYQVLLTLQKPMSPAAVHRR